MPEATARTVHLHRVLRCPPEKVYRAFLDADALAKWLPPYGYTCKVLHMDARVGGGFRMSFQHFGSGNAHSFGGQYLELVPDERLRYNDVFDDPNLPGAMEVTTTPTGRSRPSESARSESTICVSTPSQGRAIDFAPPRAVSTTSLTMFAGIAKPMPMLPPERE